MTQRINNFGLCGLYFGLNCVISVATLDLYLQCVNVEATKAWKMVKNALLPPLLSYMFVE